MLKKARIAGVGGFKPPLVTNDDYIAVFGRAAKVVDRKMRGKSRYSALDLMTGRPRYSNTEMAEQASRAALRMADLEPNDIDLVVFSSATPDYLLPPAYTLLQERLGVRSWMGFDIRSGCAGFGTAMVVATQLVAIGMARRALIVGSDLFSSRYLPYFDSHADPHSQGFPLKTLFNLMFFGDGAGALVIDDRGDEETGIFGVAMASDRAHLPFGSLIPIGGSLHPFPTAEVPREDWPVTQDGPLTHETIPEVAGQAIERFLEVHGLALSDCDRIVMPVIDEYMRAKLVERFPDLSADRVVSIGPEGGALINAAIPLSLAEGLAQGVIKKGQRVLIYAAENTRWQHAVIGANW